MLGGVRIALGDDGQNESRLGNPEKDPPHDPERPVGERSAVFYIVFSVDGKGVSALSAETTFFLSSFPSGFSFFFSGEGSFLIQYRLLSLGECNCYTEFLFPCCVKLTINRR